MTKYVVFMDEDRQWFGRDNNLLPYPWQAKVFSTADDANRVARERFPCASITILILVDDI